MELLQQIYKKVSRVDGFYYSVKYVKNSAFLHVYLLLEYKNLSATSQMASMTSYDNGNLLMSYPSLSKNLTLNIKDTGVVFDLFIY